MISQTEAFTRRVRDHMDGAPVTATPDTRCDEVLADMRRHSATAAVITGPAGEALGILTEQDVSRRVAFLVPPETPVARVMSAPVVCIDADDHLHKALARMRRESVRHMPVTDAGSVTGMLELDRVLARISARTVAQVELLSHGDSLEGLAEAHAGQLTIAAQMQADQVPAPEIQQLLSRLNHELYREVLRLCLREMAPGHGPPPARFDVVVMGSGGRGESLLRPDQDNGFVIEDYPDADHTRIDAWFVELAGRMTQGLDRVGLPFCQGNVMASNPMWRKTLSQWQSQIGLWFRRGEGNYLRYCDIFFDFVSVYGDGGLSEDLRRFVTANAARPVFLRELYKVDEDHDVALGPFGWLLPERRKGPDRGKLNLKQTGTLPLVSPVRVMALQKQVPATSTLARIAGLHACGALNDNEQDYLSGAYRHITGLLLRQQLADAARGLTPGSHVPRNALSKREKDMLIDGFRAIRAFRSKLRSDLTGEIF